MRRFGKIEQMMPAEPGWRVVLVRIMFDWNSVKPFLPELIVRRVIGWALIEPLEGLRQLIEGIFGQEFGEDGRVSGFMHARELDGGDHMLGYLEPGQDFHAEEWAHLVQEELQAAIENWNREHAERIAGLN